MTELDTTRARIARLQALDLEAYRPDDGFPDTIPTLPVGLDQQGRFQTRQQPAEACSEFLEDKPEADPVASAIFWNAYAVFFLVAIVAAVAVYWP